MNAALDTKPAEQARLFQRYPLPERDIVEGGVFRITLYNPPHFPHYAVRVANSREFVLAPGQNPLEEPAGDRLYIVKPYGDDDEQTPLPIRRSCLLDFCGDENIHPENVPHLDEMMRDWAAYREKMKGQEGQSAVGGAAGSERQTPNS